MDGWEGIQVEHRERERGSWGYRNQPPFLREFLEGKKTAREKLMAQPFLSCFPTFSEWFPYRVMDG